MIWYSKGLCKSEGSIGIGEMWTASKSETARPARITTTVHFILNSPRFVKDLSKCWGDYSTEIQWGIKLSNKKVRKQSFGEVSRGDKLFHKYLESFWPPKTMSIESLRKKFIECHRRENFNLSLQPPKGQLKVRGEKKINSALFMCCWTPTEENKFWFIAVCVRKKGEGTEWHFIASFGSVSVGGVPGCGSSMPWQPLASHKPPCYPFHVLPRLHLPQPPNLP